MGWGRQRSVLSIPSPSGPSETKGLAMKGRPRVRARGRWEGPIRTSLARPLAPFPTPIPLARPRGHWPWGRGPVCRASGNARRFSMARAGPGHAASKPCPGAAREKRARGVGARPTQGLFLCSHHPPSADGFVSTAGGRDAAVWEGRGQLGGGGDARVEALAPETRTLHR